MQYGVCADPRVAPEVASAGFDFIELHVQNHLRTLEGDDAFQPALEAILSAPLPALAANCFLPASHKVTGPDVDPLALERYAATAFGRAEEAGIRTIVFGSGGARQIPDGFDRDAAWKQLVWFGQLIGPLAQAHGITVVVEPLNRARGECNVLNSIGESARYVRAVDHPSVRLLADAYHWGLDNDSFGELVTNAHLLHHVHIATVPSRLPPGGEECAAFSSFFHALILGGYDGPVSIEASWSDLPSQAPAALAALVEIVAGATP
jgi:sugar phosphate isomerase/epimerase